jgi:hypothetical protein
MMFTWLGALQRCRDASKQFIGITWLGEVADDAIGHRANPNTVIGVCGDQDRRNGIARFHKAAMQLNSGHSRHMDVHDQAGGIANIRAGQKSQRGWEGLEP